MTTAQAKQANWDLTPYFDEFDGADYQAFRSAYKKDVAEQLERARGLGVLTAENAAGWAKVLVDGEGLMSRAIHIFSYINCQGAADARDERFQSERAALTAILADHGKIGVRAEAAFRDASDEAFEALLALPELEGTGYKVRRMREAGRMSMAAELEDLASDLEITGMVAWDRLYQKIAGSLEFDLEKPDGTTERVPMSRKHGLMENPDPRIRKAVLDGSNKAWEGMAAPAAAALNAISGERLALYKRRDIKHFLDAATFQAGISRKTLDAMFEAIGRKADVARGYLKTKAKLLGLEKFGFQDQAAPLPLKGGDQSIPWGEARERVVRAFGRSYPALGEFSEMAFAKDWIDWEPRAGKRPGGFCTSSYHIRESRVFMTYNDTLGDIQTLAHELGHAFHNWVMRDMRPLRRGYPMTLAETASTFAETLMAEALLDDPDLGEGDKAAALDSSLQRAVAFLLNIPMRFDFEKAVYEERAQGELSAARLNELVLRFQRERYGDALDHGQLDPMFWASKQHFFFSKVSFYNFPYSFGYLFSLGVFARFKAEGASFLPKYEELLRLTGSDSAEGVARQALGVDLESPEFWLESIGRIEEDAKRFEELAPRAISGA